METYQQNLLLASLSSSDVAGLLPHLHPVELSQKQILFEAGSSIHAVYFPTSAVVSLVITLSSGQMVESAMVGRDGVVGAASALDGKISLSRGVVQLAGNALVCDLGAFKGAALESKRLLSTLIRHEQTLFAQAQQSTACMASHPVEARLCRWLLRARDLAGSDVLPLTQEYITDMLGVSRPSVSVFAHTLQQAGMIKYSRGKIQILNLEALEEGACECYAAVKAHYKALVVDHV